MGIPGLGRSPGEEDSYVRYYKNLEIKGYSKQHAYQVQGELLESPCTSVLHGYIHLPDLKRICKAHHVSITKYLTALLIWCLYREYVREGITQKPISINVPINLRNFFESETTRNFFAVSMIEFLPKHQNYTFEEVLASVSEEMDQKITKEKMQETISYNVSNEKKWLLRCTPLALKYLGMQWVYRQSNKATTTTLSNLGQIKVLDEFKEDITRFHFFIGVSKKQKLKCSVCTYEDELVMSFSSVLKVPYIQRAFFRELAQQGVGVKIESNGVANEKMC